MDNGNKQIQKTMSSGLFITGAVITFVYSGLIFLWYLSSEPGVRPTKFNEFGDFLAGVFGPLTLIWLILGFLQQGRELRQNGIALLKQAEELKNSVEQQRLMAEATQRQVDLAFSSHDEQSLRDRPRFSIGEVTSEDSPYGRTHSFSLTCLVANAYNVKVEMSPGIARHTLDARKSYPRDMPFSAELVFEARFVGEAWLAIIYEDERQRLWRQVVDIQLPIQRRRPVISEKDPARFSYESAGNEGGTGDTGQ